MRNRLAGREKMETNKALPIADGARFVINSRRGARATMVVKEGKFIVLEGSTALTDTYAGMTSYVKLKNSLVSEGALVRDGNLLRFSRDVQFDSISAAANIVLDRNSNGNKEWRHEKSMKCYGDWLEATTNVNSKK